MFEFLKTEGFCVIFSFVLGVAIFAILTPVCTGKECRIQKAPPADEVQISTYQLGHKCFKFRAEPVDCPKEGVIEPFERMAGSGGN
jgi:hypothetical protein